MTKPAIILIAIVAFGLSGIATSTASAGGFGFYVASPGYGYSVGAGHGFYGGYRTAYYGGRGYCDDGWDRDHEWHDTSHYDYHPPTVVRHRNHFHYVPGHYDFHRTGHLHHYHP
jgi:hypothetical protein